MPEVRQGGPPARHQHDPLEREPHRPDRTLGGVLSLLAVFGPISMDVYLPVLPNLAGDLGASTSGAQLTVTACLVGLGLGQLVAGPLSDRFGRRRPLLLGTSAFVVASLLCAVAPTIETLIAARLAQGLAGAVGIVIAQAAGRDLYSGGQLLRYYSRLTVLSGLAAIIGPVVGGQLTRFTSWRGTFVFLAVVGFLILIASITVMRETLPATRRRTGGLLDSVRVFRTLLRDRIFVGAVLVTGFAYVTIFAYLSGATFVLQGQYGLSPQGYSYSFAFNSLGVMLCGFITARTSQRSSPRATLIVGLTVVLAGAGGVLATSTLHLPLAAMMLSLFIMVSGVAIAAPAATSLALQNHPDKAGSASSLLGLARYGFGSLAAPLVGVAGPDTAVPLGIATFAAAVLAFGGYALTKPIDG